MAFSLSNSKSINDSNQKIIDHDSGVPGTSMPVFYKLNQAKANTDSGVEQFDRLVDQFTSHILQL